MALFEGFMMGKSKCFYDCIASFYFIVHIGLFYNRRKLIQLVNSKNYNRILEIGIADGTYLHRYNTKEIYGIDQSEKMIKLAKENNPKNNNLYQMNGESLHFEDEMFDAVVLSHVITVVDNIDRLLMQSIRVLKPNGHLYILNHFVPDNQLKWVDKLFSLVSNFLYFQSNFSIDEIEKRSCALVKIYEIELPPFSYFRILILKKI